MEQTISNFYGALFKQGTARIRNINIKFDAFNDYLRTIGFVAVKWPDSEEVILKQCQQITKRLYGNILHPWNKSTSKKASKAIISLCNNETLEDRAILNLLLKENFIKEDENGNFKLTLKSIINFEKFLLKYHSKDYKKCSRCRMIVKGRRKHSSCNKANLSHNKNN